MRKLSKKDCRLYAQQKWQADRSRGLFMAESVKHIVRTAIKNIGGQRVLVLYLYPTQRADTDELYPSHTVFQGREDYITMVRREDGTLDWRTATLWNMNRDYQFTNKCAFFSKADERRVLQYCKNRKEQGFDALDQLQEQIKDKRELERRHAKQRITIAKMKCVPPMPRGIKEWLRREVMPAYIYYDYQKKGSVQGYCTACRHTVEVQPKHNQKGICPHCKRLIQFKSRGKRGYISDRETAVVVQQLNNHTLLLRILKSYFTYRKEDVAEEYFSETIRIFFSADEAGRYHEDAFHFCSEPRDLTPWKPGFPPIRYLYQENFYARTCGHLFCRDLDKELEETPWQYSQIKAFYQSDRTPLEVQTYLKKYLGYPQIEMLVKMGLIQLTADFIYRDSPYKVSAGECKPFRFFCIQPEEWPVLLERRAGGNEVMLMQKLNHHPLSYKKRIKLFLWCCQNNFDEYQVRSFLQYVTVDKLIGYTEKQYAILQNDRTQTGQIRYSELSSILQEYEDYLRLCRDEGSDLKSSSVLFPKNLKTAHDSITKRIKIRKDKEQQRKFKQVLKKLGHSLDFEQNGLAIIPPASMQDLAAEGSALSHCVGRYVGSMADSQCVILFIRRKDDMQKPFYTVEVQNGKVIQVKGFQNGSATPEVEAFMEAWEKQVLSKRLPAAA